MNHLQNYSVGIRRVAGNAKTGVLVALAAMSSLFYSFAAFAATDPGAAITSEVTAAKSTISGILVVLAGVVGLFILWSYLKRAK